MKVAKKLCRTAASFNYIKEVARVSGKERYQTHGKASKNFQILRKSITIVTRRKLEKKQPENSFVWNIEHNSL